jgi:PPM family protein phosphatase
MELTVQLGDSPRGFRVVKRTDPGDRAMNQDALQVVLTGEWLLCVLADGAGGHRGGEVASRHAVDAFLALFRKAPTQNPDTLQALLQQVNRQLLGLQQSEPGLSDMHSTFCALVFHTRNRQATWLHAGDSRVYHFRQHRCVSRTLDHSMHQWMKDHGQALAGNRNSLYSALGEAADQLRIDVSETVVAQAGDWFLLCSDGLWEHFNEQELGLMGSNLRHEKDCCAHVHELALERARGLADNLSSIMLFIE